MGVLARCKPDNPNQGAMYKASDEGYERQWPTTRPRQTLSLQATKVDWQFAQKEFEFEAEA